jgi:hypothetical protein
MSAKVVVILLAGCLLGSGTTLLVKQADAQVNEGGAGLAQPRTWEFKIVSFPDPAKAGEELTKLTADRWEYVGLVNATGGSMGTGIGTPAFHDSLVAFKRPKK